MSAAARWIDKQAISLRASFSATFLLIALVLSGAVSAACPTGGEVNEGPLPPEIVDSAPADGTVIPATNGSALVALSFSACDSEDSNLSLSIGVTCEGQQQVWNDGALDTTFQFSPTLPAGTCHVEFAATDSTSSTTTKSITIYIGDPQSPFASVDWRTSNAPSWTHGDIASTNGNYTLAWTVTPPSGVSGLVTKLTELSASAAAGTAPTEVTVSSTSYSISSKPAGTYLYQVRLCAGVNCGPVSELRTVRVGTQPNAGLGQTPPFIDTISWLYSGSNPRQIGVTPGAFDPKRVVVVRGKVLDDNATGTALADVRVESIGHPEYGYTLTQSNGEFDLVVNAETPLRLKYTKSNKLPVERQVSNVPRDFAYAPDVVMTSLDPATTAITLGSSSLQVARGSLKSDADGPRQATVLFPAGTTADLVAQNGTTTPIGSLTVRATEYTVGPRGYLAMPGELPPTSGYTYAVELSANEAVAAGARSVEFSQDLPVYLENFRNNVVGSAVPSGYFDTQTGAWKASTNGRVIKILAESGSPLRADIDVTGDGVADSGTTLSDLGVTDAERAQLATLYNPNQSLWRVPVRHFTPYDFNYPWGPDGDAQRPKTLWDLLDWLRAVVNCLKGSVIECQNQTVIKGLGSSGAAPGLAYRSDIQAGFTDDRKLRFPLFNGEKPEGITAVTVQVFVAGRRFEEVKEGAALTGWDPEELYEFNQWDGTDVYGRPLYTSTRARVRLGYTYRAVYYTVPSDFDNAFGRVPEVTWFDVNNYGREDGPDITIWQEVSVPMGHWDARQAGLGGWTLSPHDFYDSNTGRLHRGNGTVRLLGELGKVTTTVAGVFGTPPAPVLGTYPYAYEVGTTPVNAVQVRGLGAVSLATRGTETFIGSETDEGSRVYRLNDAGMLTRFAGGGEKYDDNYSGSALAFDLGAVADISMMPDKSLLYADEYNARVWRVSASGVLTRFAGNGESTLEEYYPSQDGGLAIDAAIGTPIAVASTADGTVYVAHRFHLVDGISSCYPTAVRRIDTNGQITSIMGQGLVTCPGIFGPPPNFEDPAHLYLELVDLAVGPDGSLYLAAGGVGEIGRVIRAEPSGRFVEVAGNGEYLDPDPRLPIQQSGAPATSVAIDPNGIAIDANGGIYITEGQLIRYVGSDGFITVVAGNNSCVAESASSPFPEGGAAEQSRLCNVRGLALSDEGRLVYADRNAERVRTLAAANPTDTLDQIIIPEYDGDGYSVFTSGGRQLYARDAYTGATVLNYGYDSDGLLSFLADGNGNRLDIRSQGGGVALADYSNRQTLLAGPSGSARRSAYLTNLTDQDSNQTALTYYAGGLIQSEIDPNNSALPANDPTRTIRSQYSFDGNGRLHTAQDSTGRITTLSRAQATQGFTTTSSSVQGRTRTDSALRYNSGAIVESSESEDGLPTEIVRCPDGRRIVKGPNGVRGTVHLRSDQRFGMLAPVGDFEYRFGGTAPSNDCEAIERVGESYWNGNSTGVAPEASFTIAQDRQVTGSNRLAPDTITETATIIPMYSSAGTGAPVPCDNRAAAGATNPRIKCRKYTTVFNAATSTYTGTTPMGRTYQFKVDPMGNLVSYTAPGAAAVSNVYDTRGRLVQSAQGAGSNLRLAQYAYYANSGIAANGLNGSAGDLMRVSAKVAPNRILTSEFGYDSAGRINAVRMPGGLLGGSQYDRNGNMTSAVMPGPGTLAERTHAFSFSASDQLRTYTPPAVGNVVGGTEWVYSLDGQIDRILMGDAADRRTIQFNYENGRQRLGSVNFSRGAISYTYYGNGGQQVQQVSAPGSVTTSLTYFGNLPKDETTHTPNFDATVTYHFDHNLWPTSLVVGTDSIPYDYDLDGDLIKAGDLNVTRQATTGWVSNSTLGGTTETYVTRNEFGEPTEIVNSAKFEGSQVESLRWTQQFSYDPAGRISQETETLQTRANVGASPVTTTQVKRYEYDEHGRLAYVKDANNTVLSSYGYDARGNRTIVNGATVAQYDAQDRLLTNGAAFYTYRSSGERLTKTVGGQTTQYSYDEFGNLTNIVVPGAGGAQIAYQIDGMNRRVGKLVNGSFVQGWVYKDPLKPVAAIGANGAVVQTFVYGEALQTPEYIIDKTTGTTRKLRYITDARGSVRFVVDTQTGQVVQQISYDPWGAVVSDSNPGFQPFGYAGGQYDHQTGLVRFGVRDYDPASGTWTTKDPMGLAAGGNVYAYVSGDPINNVDPTGLVEVNCFVVQLVASLVPGYGIYQALRDPNATFFSVATAVALEFPWGKAFKFFKGLSKLSKFAKRSRLAKNSKRGRASESRVLSELGLTKNTKRVSTDEGVAIPDGLTDLLSIEIKDAANVSLTRQLRIQTEAARATGRQSVLITGKNTKVSPAADAAFDIIRRLHDLGPPGD